MPTAFLAIEALFHDEDMTVWDWEQGIHIARGHLTSAQLDAVITEYNRGNTPDQENIAVIPGSLKHTWTRFPAHEPDCLVHASVHPDDDDIDLEGLCDCDGEEAQLHEAAPPDTADAIAVTWLYTYNPGDPFRPDYQQEPDEAQDYVDRQRALGWFDDATDSLAPTTCGAPLQV